MTRTQIAVVGSARCDRRALLRSTALQAVAALVLGLPAAAQPAPNARPTGGTVSAGSAAIARTPAATNITQSSQRAAIDWTSYNVGSQQTVNYAQPSATSVTLNRVTGADPSAIAGQIRANGQVIITNPNGVVFYKGAQVDTQSIVVSAPGITNQNFMAGRMVFDQAPNPSARVENRGTITVSQAGLAALVAPSVANSGTINARMGQVILAGAQTHTLDMYGDGLVAIDVTGKVLEAPGGQTALVTNTGLIRADGGVVQLTARAADGVVTDLVRAGGHIRANSVGNRTGRIEVTGTGGSVVIEGRLAADGRAPGTIGGDVLATADATVNVSAAAHVSANGRTGGGTVALGTTLARARSTGPAPAGTAARVVMAAGSKVSADATDNGPGGRVTLLSTQTTLAGGTLTARGGRNGGDGGTIELSGELGFRLTGAADTSAAKGKLGSVILDPRDLTITATTNGTTKLLPANGTDPNIGYTTPDSVTDAYVTPMQLASVTGNLHLQASRDLTVASNLTFNNGDVTLDAGRNLTVNAGVALNVTDGSLTLTAANAASPTADPTGALTILGSLTASGNLALSAGTGGVTLNGALNATTLMVTTTGPLTQTGGGITANNLFGSATNASLTSGANALTAVATAGRTFTVTGATGDFTLVTGTNLVVGSERGGVLSVQTGRTITLITDNLTISPAPSGSSVRAPGGTLAVSPYTANLPIQLTVGATRVSGSLTINGDDLGATIADTLQLGASVAGRGLPTGAITIGLPGEASDLGALSLKALTVATTGAVVQDSVDPNTSLAVGSFGGQGGSLSLLAVGNDVLKFAGFVAPGAIEFHTGDNPLLVSAPVMAGGGTSNVTISSSGVAGSDMTLAANVLGNVVSLDSSSGQATSGGITQMSGTITATTLVLSGGQFATLNGNNAITNLALPNPIALPQLPTNITAAISLTDTKALTVAGDVTAGTLTLNAPGITQSAGSTINTATLSGAAPTAQFNSATNQIGAIGNFQSPGGSFSLTDVAALTVNTLNVANGTAQLVTDRLTTTTPILTAARLQLTPLTAGRRIEVIGASAADPNALSIAQSFLNGVTATTLVLGRAGTTGAINIGNNGEAINLTGHAATLQLQTAGAVTEGNGGAATLTVPDLVGTAASVALTGNNVIGSLGAGNVVTGSLTGFAAVGGLTVTTGSALAVTNTVSAGAALTLKAGGMLTTAGLLSGSAVTLGSGAALTQTAGSITTAGTLTLTATGAVSQSGGTVTAQILTGSAGSVSVPFASVARLGPFTSTGPFALTDTQGLTLAGAVTTGDTTLAITGGLAVNAALTAGNLTVRATGAVTEAAAGSVTATSLSGNALSVALGGGNAVGTLGSFATQGGFALSDTGPLAVTGAVMDGQSIVLGASGLALSGTLTAPSVTLTATAGGITQSGGGIAAATLTGSSTGVTALTGPGNAVTTLGSFGSRGGFALVDGSALAVTGPVADAASIALATGGGLSLSGSLTTAALSLTATGAITQPGGTLSAATLTGSAASASLGQAGNAVAALGAFTTATGGFALTGGQPLRIAGAVVVPTGQAISIIDDAPSFGTGGSLSAPGGTVTLAALTKAGLTVGGGNGIGGTPPVTASTLVLGTAAGGPVTIAGALNLTTVGTLDLLSGGALSETGAGAVVVGTLTGSGASAALTGANQVGTLAGFTTAGAFALTDAANLTVAGPLNAATAALAVTGNVTLAGTVTAPTGLTLTATGAISQTAGTVATNVLTGSAGGPVALPATGNTIAAVGGFSSVGGFALTDAQALTLTGPLADATSVVLTDPAGLTLAGSVATGALTLTTAGAITQTAGALAATTLSGSAGTVSLPGANQVSTLAGFATMAAFTLNDAQPLTVAGPLAAGSVALTELGTLTLSGSITAPTITLTAASGTPSQLPAVTGAILQTGGAVAAGGVLTLVSASTISQTGGTIAAGTLTGSSTGVTALTGPGNAVTTLGSFGSRGGFALVDGSALAVTGPVADAASIALATGGGLSLSGSLTTAALSLTATGAITQPGGTLSAATLTGSAASASFGQAGNAVAALGAFTTATGGFALTGGQPLRIAGAVVVPTGQAISIIDDAPSFGTGGSLSAPGGTVTLAALTKAGLTVGGGNGIGGTPPVTASTLVLGTAAGGPVTIAGALNLTTVGTLDLLSGGALSETGAGAVVVGTLTGSGASAALTGANQVGTLAGFTTAGAFALTDAANLTVAGPLNAATAALAVTGNVTLAGTVTAPTGLTLTATGAISQTAGTVATNVLTGSAGGPVALPATGNTIAAVGGFSSVGGFALTDAQALTLTGPLADATSVVLTDPAGLTLAGSVATGALTLTTAGAITQTAGALAATTLSGSAGTVSLPGANQVSTLAGFATQTGFALANGGALAVTGPVTDAMSISLSSLGATTLSGAITAPTVMLTTVGGGLTQTGGLLTASTVLTLNAGGAVTQTGGSIATPTLTGSSTGPTMLTAPGNAVATLASFRSAGGFALVDSAALALTGPLADPTSVALTTGATLSLGGPVTTASLSLTATGAITQPSGALTVTTLTGSADSASFGQAGNAVAALGAFSAATDFALTNGTPLTIAGPVTAGQGHSISLTDSAIGFGPGGSLSAPGGTVQFAATGTTPLAVGGTTALTGTPSVTTQTVVIGSRTGGPVSFAGTLDLSGTAVLDVETASTVIQAAGSVIAVSTLTGNAGGSVTLAGANRIGTLGNFAAGALAVQDAQSLTVNGPVSATTLTLGTTGNLTLAGAVTATAVSLSASGAITQPGGALSAGTVAASGTSVGLTGANTFGTLNAVAATGAVTVNDTIGFTVAQAVTGGSVSLSTLGNLTLAANVTGATVNLAAAAIAQQGGLIQAGSLSGTAQTASLTGANQVGAVGGFTAGALMLTDAQALQLAGPVAIAGPLTLAAPSVTVSGTLSANALSVTTPGALSQTGGSTTIGTLTGSAGNLSLGQGGTLSLTTLGGFSTGTTLALADTAALTVTGPLSASSLTLAATGRLTLAGGAIAVDGVNNALVVAPNAAGASTFVQSGTTTITGRTGAGNTVRIDPLNVSFANLVAPTTTLVLALGQGGVATGAVSLGALQVVGSGGFTVLTGSVAGQTGFSAAYISRIAPAFDVNYLLNGCAIASVSCGVLPLAQGDQTIIAPLSFLRPDILTLDALNLTVTRDRDDPTLLLPNISDRDY